MQYGNIWTNIDRTIFEELKLKFGDKVRVRISQGERLVFSGRVPYFATFGGVKVGQPLLYLNSLNNVSLAINQGDFARKHNIKSGADWSIEISR